MKNEDLEKLVDLMHELRCQINTINGNPLIPSAVKAVCETTFSVLNIMALGIANG